MFFTKRSLPALNACLSPHGRARCHHNKPLCKDGFPRLNSCVDHDTENLDLGSAWRSLHISNTIPSQYAMFITRVNRNPPRALKLFLNQCESGTLIQPLKAHVWSQRRHVTSNTLDTALNLSKDGRDHSISIPLHARIKSRKRILGSGLRWRVRDFSTKLVG